MVCRLNATITTGALSAPILEVKLLFYGQFFKFARAVVRFFMSRYEVIWREEPPAPAVYLCWHLSQHGPMTSVAWLERPVHFWAYHVLCEVESCRRHFAEYTFAKRCHMPKWLSRLLAIPTGAGMAWICQSGQAVPVYRDKNSFKTMSASMKVLQKGEDIIIFPDIDYTNKNGGQELYDGFLYLERFYCRATGQHLPFIPLYIDDEEHKIFAGPAISFADGDFDSQKETVMQTILTALSGGRNPA